MTLAVKTATRCKGHGARLDDVLKEEGVFDKLQTVAIKEVIAWQIQQAMTEKGLSKNKMAQLMRTSRAQLDRLLDANSGNIATRCNRSRPFD
jgi:hypothetical protein